MAASASTGLEMRGVTKRYPGVVALDDVNLTARCGEVLALMGENGAGKSTLIKILAGAIHADSGQILLDGSPAAIRTPHQALEMGIAIIYQEFNLVPHLSVAENISLGRMPCIAPGIVDRRKMHESAGAVLADLGVDLDVQTPVDHLSVAQMQMVEIAKATSRKTRIVAMDEPSATLTEHELANLLRLVRRLRDGGVAVIYISHRMAEVFEVADRVTVLRDGRSVASQAIGEVTQASLISLMVGRELAPTAQRSSLSAGSGDGAKGEPILRLQGIGRKGKLHDIRFELHAGEILAVAGLVGSGRTEVARVIFGADRSDTGQMQVAGKPYRPRSPRDAVRCGIAFVTEDRKREGLLLARSVRENVSLAALGKVSRMAVLRRRRERNLVMSLVEQMNVRTPSIEQTAGNLSGGNQQKVVLAKWLMTQSRILIMDEPTRGIDIGAKAEIYQQMRLLADSGIAILMISSEMPEVLKMADRILVMRDGRIAGELSGETATSETVGRLALGAG